MDVDENNKNICMILDGRRQGKQHTDLKPKDVEQTLLIFQLRLAFTVEMGVQSRSRDMLRSGLCISLVSQIWNELKFLWVDESNDAYHNIPAPIQSRERWASLFLLGFLCIKLASCRMWTRRIGNGNRKHIFHCRIRGFLISWCYVFLSEMGGVILKLSDFFRSISVMFPFRLRGLHFIVMSFFHWDFIRIYASWSWG